ncbi:Pathogenesis-related protein 1A [Halotydeus destructor]|nr:Pathogenesis-related protein 1A [Halotydeus destructor]
MMVKFVIFILFAGAVRHSGAAPQRVAIRGSQSTGNDRPTGTGWQSDCLKAHNEYRERHGSDDLQLDDELTANAQRRARELARSDGTRSVDSRYGENLFYHESSSKDTDSVDCDTVVKHWYDTGLLYDYDDPENSNNFRNSGTFTQVVWKATDKVGCGQASNGQGRVYVVCNYSPPGNYRGRYGQNVARPRTRRS